MEKIHSPFGVFHRTAHIDSFDYRAFVKYLSALMISKSNNFGLIEFVSSSHSIQLCVGSIRLIFDWPMPRFSKVDLDQSRPHYFKFDQFSLIESETFIMSICVLKIINSKNSLIKIMFGAIFLTFLKQFYSI